MYTCATSSMLADLKQLWQECFMDDMEYIDFYFHQVAGMGESYDNILVTVIDKKPVSMLTMIPATIWIHGKRTNIFYIYAVATAKEYRKKGYAAGLLAYAYEVAQRTNAALMLVPASETLFLYYEKLGFRSAFVIEKETIDRNQVEKTKINSGEKSYPFYTKEEIDDETYALLRETAFCKDGDVSWKKEQIHYAWLENQYLGGKSYRITYSHVDYFLMGCPVEGTYYVREHDLPVKIAKEVFLDLAKEGNCDKISIKSKVCVSKEGSGSTKESAYGMVFPKETPIKGGYLGLALD